VEAVTNPSGLSILSSIEFLSLFIKVTSVNNLKNCYQYLRLDTLYENNRIWTKFYVVTNQRTKWRQSLNGTAKTGRRCSGSASSPLPSSSSRARWSNFTDQNILFYVMYQ
jgi:hypothetical protein